MDEKTAPKKRIIGAQAFLDWIIKNRPEVELASIYVGTVTPASFLFIECGHISIMTPTSIKSGSGCLVCSGYQIIPETSLGHLFPILSLEWHPDKNKSILPIHVSPGSHKKVWWKYKCGHEAEQGIRDRVAGQNCGLCNGTHLKTHEEYCCEVAMVHGDQINVLDKYNGRFNKILHSCSKCGFKWPSTPGNILNNSGCPMCSGRIKTHNMYLLEVKSVHNDKITVIGQYIASQTKIDHQCTDCKFIWAATPNNIVNKKSGCPKCAYSKGAMAVLKFLEQLPYLVEHEKRFFDCRDIQPLPFDFFLRDLNTCIEYDGQQHFEMWRFSDVRRGQRKLNIIKNHDMIKNKYCSERNINLIRISYIEFEAQILEEYLEQKLAEIIVRQNG